MNGTKKLTLGIGDFNSHVGKKVDEFQGLHRENGTGQQNFEGRMLLKFCNQKQFICSKYMVKKGEKEEDYSSGGNKTEIDFVLVEKESRKFLKDIKVIPWELQNRLVIVDIKKKNLFKHIKIKQNVQWRV